MTIYEVIEKYGRRENGYISCAKCPVAPNGGKCGAPDNDGYDSCWEYIAKEMTKRETESVEHPAHYAGGKYECIEVMREVYGDDAVKDFCLLNAFKYLWRCNKKHDNAVTDIKKANFYLEKYIELEEGAKENGEQQTEPIAEGA